jgi:hypothetical protein
MAAHHLDEGVLGWVLAAAAIAGGLTLTGLAGYLGARLARVIDDNLTEPPNRRRRWTRGSPSRAPPITSPTA